MSAGQKHQVVIDKLIHGGQGLGTLADGKKALVWNTLPEEKVIFTPRKSKSSFVEGVAEEVIDASSNREVPRDELYLSTSPWQMMTYEAENKYKQEILNETLKREGVNYSDQNNFIAPDSPWYYRNKMEYSFFGDNNGLHLALYNRGTHRKQIVSGSSIARTEIDETANKICKILNDKKIRAGDLKSLIVRCNRAGECVAALFTRNQNLSEISALGTVCKGVVVYFSNPKSPASVITHELYKYGDLTLEDELLGRLLKYNVVSFFQVNLEPYEVVLRRIKNAVGSNSVTDMYAGVGSIGLSVASKPPTLIEIDASALEMAKINAQNSNLIDIRVISSTSERALEHIPSATDTTLIVDPPRAGLHTKLTEAVVEKGPGQVVYLSCNPSTLARDLKLLQDSYKIIEISGYNFFPRTPHIEALAILERVS